MFSDWKQALFEVKDGIVKQHRLVIAYLIWISLCTFWGTYNNINIYEFYQIDISMADLLILQQRANYTGIMIFPLAAFLITKCKQKSLNIQYILRYGSRKRTLQKQIIGSVWYSVVVTVSLVVVQLICGWIQNGILINWNSVSGLYYNKLGVLSESNVIWVILGIVLLYFIKFLIVFVCIDILQWYPKAIVLIWILLVLFAGIEILLEKSVFYSLFAIRYELWKKPIRHVILCGCGVICVGIEYLCGSTFIKRKDIFR